MTSPDLPCLSHDPQVTVQGEWSLWISKVPKIEVETHNVGAPDVVVPTLDTVRHESLLYTWLQEHKPMVLCGPPGSGKTMTLFSALRSLPDYEVCVGEVCVAVWLCLGVWVCGFGCVWCVCECGCEGGVGVCVVVA